MAAKAVKDAARSAIARAHPIDVEVVTDAFLAAHSELSIGDVESSVEEFRKAKPNLFRDEPPAAATPKGSKEFEITLTGGRKATVKRLNALELISATSFAGSEPSEPVINMVTSVCSISKLDGEAVTPCHSRAQFLALAPRLNDTDLLLIGMALAESMLDEVSDEQKKAIRTIMNQGTENS